MTQVFDENNRLVPVTVVKAGPCVVTQVRTPEVDGYSALQLGFGEIDPAQGEQARRRALHQGGRHAAAAPGGTAHRGRRAYTVGQELTADVFDGVAKVDVIGTSKGKGTAGVMKRHGFKGLGAGHGTQRKHRSPGSIGGASTPGRVFKGLQDGRPHGPRARRRLVPGRAQGGHRARAAADQGRRSRSRRAASSSSAPRSRVAPWGVTTSDAFIDRDAHRPPGRRPHPGGETSGSVDAAR